jgi:hypothetical protein
LIDYLPKSRASTLANGSHRKMPPTDEPATTLDGGDYWRREPEPTQTKIAQGRRRTLSSLADPLAHWHNVGVVFGRVINFEARHVEKQDDEGQASLSCAPDRLVNGSTEMLDCYLLFHRDFLIKGTKMTDSRLAELRRLKEMRETPPEILDSLRLLKMFIKLSPDQRRDIIELVERYLTR